MVSTSVKENLEKASDFWDDLQKDIYIQKLISDDTMKTYILDKNEYIKKENPTNFTFKKDETKEIRFSFFLSPIDIHISINKGWPIFAHFVDVGASYESAFSWVVFTWTSFTGMTIPSASWWILYLKNFGGATDFKIETREPFILEETNYHLMKKVWGKWLLQKVIKKRNFFSWDYPWFPYQNFGFEF